MKRWILAGRRRPRHRPRPAGLRHARRAAARLDLPAQRPQLGRRRRPPPRAWTTSGSSSSPRSPASRPSCTACGCRPTTARPTRPGAAVPARRALERLRLGPAHPPHAGAGLLGAGHRLPRLRQEHGRPALRGDGLRGCAAPPGTGWPRKYPDRPRYVFGHSLGGAIAIDLASKVDDEQRHHRRRHLHLHPRRGQHHEVGLAAGRPADHAALRLDAARWPGSARRCWWCTAPTTA